MKPRMIVMTLLIIAGCTGAEVAAGDRAEREIPVSTQRISTFKARSDQVRFGGLEFVGGLEYWSSDKVLGGISGIRLTESGDRFVGVMDTGYLFTGRFERNSAGRLSGIADFRVAPMRDAGGNVVSDRRNTDAEGLVLNGENAFVSFERQHRIERYRLRDLPDAAPVARVRHPIPDHEFRNNRGMEAIAIAPTASPLDGSMVVVSERSLNREGNNFAAIVDGPKKGVFFVRRHAPYDVTDGDFLPNGDLLLLERRYSLAGGIGMRIRRILGGDIAAGETVDGAVLMEADGGYQIDNMESLDVFTAPDGSTRILLGSDDNHSLLQRNLLLEFRPVE
jgi:hypothetical protein